MALGNDVDAADAAVETALHGWSPLAIAEGIYFGASDTRSDTMAALFRSLGAEPTPPDVERDANIARLKARSASAR